MKKNSSLYVKNRERKIKDNFQTFILGSASAITVGILVFIFGFIFIKGFPLIDAHFLTSDYDDKTSYIQVEKTLTGASNPLGLELAIEDVEGDNVLVVAGLTAGSKASEAVIQKVSSDGKQYIYEPFKIKKGMALLKVEGISLTEVDTVAEAEFLLADIDKNSFRLKVQEIGGGVIPMLITTIYMIILSILISVPIGVFAAIYLVEYAKPGLLVRIIRFGTESLAGIPSIIYGLFGMLFFVGVLKLGFSLLAGSLTVSIILLPVIIRQTEESLKAVPDSYREASLGLGANKLYTIRHAILPSALSGILVAVILSIGRIVGESAALLFTAGTVARIPGSLKESGATLTVKAYQVAKEEGNIEVACAIGSVILVVVLGINLLSKFISNRFVDSKK